MNNPGNEERIGEPSRSETEARTKPRLQGREAASFRPTTIALPESLSRLLSRYPSLQRHPHPFIVHFPIVFTLAVAFFSLLYLLAGVASFETTAFHCLGATVFTLPLAILTGELTRRVNYSQEPKQAFRIELRSSYVLLALSGVAFLWRWFDPSILRNFRWASILYLTIILSLPLIATIISYFGGLLTFPLEKEEN